jgi:hypothetical protein
MKITLEEIASELSKMGTEAARERLNFFKDQKAISILEYMRLWHLVNGGDPEDCKVKAQNKTQNKTPWQRIKEFLFV